MDLLLRKLQERLEGRSPAKPSLRVVSAEYTTLTDDDAITRDCRIRRVRWLAKAYRLQPLVDQHCFNLAGIYSLGRGALEALHRDMESAREALADGIPLEDTGLIRSTYLEAV